MRDDSFLVQRLDQIWQLLFPEVDRKNNVVIRFKGRWKNKFGHIKMLRNKDTEIAINGLFKDMRVPEYVIDLTISHELVHYMHGFNSPLEKKHKHPHKGGIVDKELVMRGFGNMIKLEREFVKKEWPLLLKEIYKEKEIKFVWNLRRFF
ncbi:hypothetical protein HYX19_05285 [Candidatus Woesearchaeota archaeon]|nr:hypothetical protein [Candidatus Woesearchaeota archaeon]